MSLVQRANPTTGGLKKLYRSSFFFLSHRVITLKLFTTEQEGCMQYLEHSREGSIWKKTRCSQTATAEKAKAEMQIYRSLQDRPKGTNTARSLRVLRTAYGLD